MTTILRTRHPDTIDGESYLARATCPFSLGSGISNNVGGSLSSCTFSELHPNKETAAAALVEHLSTGMHDNDELAALLVEKWPESIVSLRLVPER